MTASPERIAANQANSQRSTGPRTDAGKLVSRRNSLKHGLTGAGLALPDEDKAELDAAFDRHFEQMQPQTQAGLAMTFKVALCAIRLDRFATAESAVVSQRVLDAGYVFDDAQFVRLDEAKAKLHKNPKAQLAVLSRFEIGVDWVLEAWDALTCALISGKLKNWRQPQYDLLEALLGRSPEFPSYDDTTMWSLAAKGDEGALDDPDLPGETRAARCQSARDLLLAVCEEETKRWEAMLEAATLETATARDNAIQAARYDGSKDGLLMKKYEAATYREMNKALKDFPLVEAEYAGPEPVVEIPQVVEPCVELGSFLPEPDRLPAHDDPIAIGNSCIPTQTAQITLASDTARSDSASTVVPAFETSELRLL